MTHLNLFAFAGLSVAISCFILAIFIWRFAQNQSHRLWALFNVMVACWAAGTALVGVSTDPELAAWNWKLAVGSATFISIFFYHFVISFCQIERTKMLILAYLQGFLFLASIMFTNLFINEIYYLSKSSIYYFKANLIFNISFAIWGLIVCNAFLELHKFIKIAGGIKRIQAQYIFWGMLLGFIGGTSSYLPGYGIVIIYPAWQISICVYVPLMTYAILKHELLDIQIVFKRSVIYSALVAFVSLAYVIVVVALGNFLQGIFHYSSNTISLSLAFFIGILVLPLRNRIQYFLDKTLFKGTQVEIAAQNEFLLQEVADKEKFKSVAVLASGMAHEIKNPLTAIKTFSEYLPLKMNDPEFLRKFSRIVGKEADRINTLVHQLLEFSRPSEPKMEETPIQNLIDEVLEFLSSQFINYNIKVEKNFESNGNVMIDPNQFRQVFLNLFINAVEAMPKGGTLTVETSVGNGHARSLQSNHIQITIADTGAGIHPAILKNLFAPFHTTKAKGTGLGLTITKSIIEEHKGKIRVESELGNGTRFIVELPAVL